MVLMLQVIVNINTWRSWRCHLGIACQILPDRRVIKFCTNVCNVMKEMDVKNAEIRKKAVFDHRSIKTWWNHQWPTRLQLATIGLFLSLPHFDVICHLKLNRHTAKRNMFIKQIRSEKDVMFIVFKHGTWQNKSVSPTGSNPWPIGCSNHWPTGD